MTGLPLEGGDVLDLAIQPGELVLLDGPNGSGKSTLLRTIAGLPAHRRPRQILWNDRVVIPGATSKGIHLALQDPRDTLVGLTVAGEFRLRGLPIPARIARLQDRDVATLSSGETRQVSLAVAGANDKPPTLLLLDEPCEGLGDAGRAALVALIAQARTTGAVLAVDHSGLLGPLATRTITLAPESSVGLTPIPRANDQTPVLVAPARETKRADTKVDLPAISLPAGFHCLVGENGAGKSTLLLHVAGLLKESSRQPQVQIAGQFPSPGKNVRLLLPRARDLFTHPSVAAELDGMQPAPGLVDPALLPRHPLTLSGGEAQRVALAKTLGAQAEVYLLDEPEAHLDAAGWSALWAAINARVEGGACVLAATHDARLHVVAHSILRMEAP